MKKEELRHELTELIRASIALEEASALTLRTAQFLSDECDRLLKIVDSTETSFEERESTIKALDSILGKMEHESRMLKKDDGTQVILDRLKVLEILSEQGLIEE